MSICISLGSLRFYFASHFSFLYPHPNIPSRAGVDPAHEPPTPRIRPASPSVRRARGAVRGLGQAGRGKGCGAGAVLLSLSPGAPRP